MTRITTRMTAAATAALTGLTLAACTSDTGGPIAAPTSDAVTTSPAPSGSPSPEPNTVVVAPERPDAMDDDGPKGAEAAAKYFLALDSYMQASGDTTAWDAMADVNCVFCDGRREQALEIAARGYRWSEGESSVTTDHVYAQDSATGIWPIDVTMYQAPVTVTDANGGVVSEIPASSASVRVEVVRQESGWIFLTLADRPN